MLLLLSADHSPVKEAPSKYVRFHRPPSEMWFEAVREDDGHRLVLAPDVSDTFGAFLWRSGPALMWGDPREPATGAECRIGGVPGAGGVVFGANWMSSSSVCA